jgi:hypothetical protein
MFRLLQLIASILLCTGLGLACASWVGGPRLREIRDVGCFLLEQYERTETLRLRRELTMQCYEGKKRVTAEVVAGRIGLLEAAAQFRALHAPLEDGYDPVSGTSDGPVSEKYLCWNVLAWARDRLQHSPEPDGALLQRLEKEYREHFQEEPTLPAHLLLAR